MTTTRRNPLLTGIDLLGMATLAGIVLNLVLPGAVAESLPTSLRSMLIPGQAIQLHANDQANCLWLQARNHGFYGIQHQAVTGIATADEDRLWKAFLDSTGEQECGSPLTAMSELRPALIASLSEADRHFMRSTDEPGVMQVNHLSLRHRNQHAHTSAYCTRRAASAVHTGSVSNPSAVDCMTTMATRERSAP